jgi:hypothetical protein
MSNRWVIKEFSDKKIAAETGYNYDGIYSRYLFTLWLSNYPRVELIIFVGGYTAQKKDRVYMLAFGQPEKDMLVIQRLVRDDGHPIFLPPYRWMIAPQLCITVGELI